MITTVQAGILQDVDKQHQDDHGITNQLPPRNLSMPSQQQHQEQQMSQALVDQHPGIGVSRMNEHSSHSLDHAHSLAEHAAHSMLDLSETGGSLEHLAGHPSQSLADLASRRASDQSLDSYAANGGRRQPQSQDRVGGLSDGSGQSMRQMSNNDRDMSALNCSISNNISNNLVSRSLSGLGGSSLDRQNQPMRNLTPLGTDGRGMPVSLASDGRQSVGLSTQSMASCGSNGNSLPHSRGNFNAEQTSQSLLDSIASLPQRGRPPSHGGVQHNLGTVDQQLVGQSLPPHLRGLSDLQGHSHNSLVDPHNQQSLGGEAGSGSHNGQGGMSVFGMDSSSGQIHSRPGSTLLSESSSHSDGRDLSQSVYSTTPSSGDRMGGHASTSLIEETIAAVASNLRKSSPDGGIMPGPLPPNSLLGLGHLGIARSSSASAHLDHPGDESLVDLVNKHQLARASSAVAHLDHPGDDTLGDFVSRHHTHGIPMLSDRASQSLSGLMDDHPINHSPLHGQGRELEKTHPCLTCLKLFRSKQQLAQHTLVHTGIRKHVCSFCDRAFKQLSHLQQHVRIHTGEKPYRCKFENCERAFAQLSNLQHHMRNHDDQVKKEATRIHKCQICHRCYTNESSLKSHTLKMHIHIKPIDQHAAPLPKKRRKRKNKDPFGGAPTMVPVSSSAEGAFPGVLPGMKAGGSRHRSPTSSDEDDDEIIFVGEQVAPPRMDNFGGMPGGLGSSGQLQGPGSRSHDLGHQIPFSGMGNFSRGADPLALLASANRFTLQDNIIPGLGGPLNSFTDQLPFRDAALLNSRFGDLRGGSSQGSSFDDRFSSGSFNQHQAQRDRDGFGNHNDLSGRNSGGNGSSNSTSGSSGGGDNIHPHISNSGDNRNQISAHNQSMLRAASMGGLGAGMMHGTGQGLGNLMKQIKQEPLDYFPSSCHGNEQFAGMGVGGTGGFLSPQHIINSHLRGQLPSLNVPLIRDHFSHNQMLPHSSSSSVSSGSSSTPNTAPPPSSSTTHTSTLPSSIVSLPLPLTQMGLYQQGQYSTPQRMSGLHPSPASTPSSQMSVGANLPSNLSSQGGRSPLEQEDLRCFSPLRN